MNFSLSVPEKKNYLIDFLLFAMFVFLYAAFIPDLFHQHWDSLDFSYNVEQYGMKSIWGNHPLGHVVLNSIYLLLVKIGYSGKALTVFQHVNIIIAAASVVILFRGLYKLFDLDIKYALSLAILFGGTNGYWNFCTSADMYTIAVFFEMLTWLFLFRYYLQKGALNLVLTGVFLGLSVLAHQMNFILALPIFLLLISDENKQTALWRIFKVFVVALVVSLLGYLLFGFLAISSFHPVKVFMWMKGYAGDSTYGRFLNLSSLPMALRLFAYTFTEPDSNFIQGLVRLFLLLLIVLPILYGLCCWKKFEKSRLVIFMAALGQCVVGFGLIWWWDPGNTKFWPLLLFPMITMIGITLKTFDHNSRKKIMVTVYCAILPMILIYNLVVGVLPRHEPRTELTNAVQPWLDNTGPNDLLFTAGDMVPLLRYYFGRRNTAHFYRYVYKNESDSSSFVYMRNKIKAFHDNGSNVFITPALVNYMPESRLKLLNLTRKEIRAFFDTYPSEYAFNYPTVLDGKSLEVIKLLPPEVDADSLQHQQ